MYRTIISLLFVVGYKLSAYSQQLPLVYQQEHTGKDRPPLVFGKYAYHLLWR